MTHATHNIPDGSKFCSYCRVSIYNRGIDEPCTQQPPAPPQGPPTWARKLAVERAGLTGYPASGTLDKMTNVAAELIAKYEQEPVNPDVLRARQIAQDNRDGTVTANFISGDYDETFAIRCIVKALSEGRYNGLTAAYDLLYAMDKDHVFDDLLSRIASLRSKNLW